MPSQLENSRFILEFLLTFGNRTAEVQLTTHSPLTDRRDHEGELFSPGVVSLCAIRVSDEPGPTTRTKPNQRAFMYGASEGAEMQRA